jgi:hypothetical protein
MTAFKTQQARWAKGLIQTSKKSCPASSAPTQPFHTKLEAWYHLTANISYPLMIVLSTLLMPAMIIRFYQGWCRCCSSTSRSSWPPPCPSPVLLSRQPERALPRTWYKTFLYLPFLMSLGIGLTITNTKAVWKRSSASRAPSRTPKYRVQKEGREVQAKRKSTASASASSPGSSCAIGCYFAAPSGTPSPRELLHRAVPAALRLGYWYTGLLSIFQGLFDSLISNTCHGLWSVFTTQATCVSSPSAAATEHPCSATPRHAPSLLGPSRPCAFVQASTSTPTSSCPNTFISSSANRSITQSPAPCRASSRPLRTILRQTKAPSGSRATTISTSTPAENVSRSSDTSTATRYAADSSPIPPIGSGPVSCSTQLESPEP